MNLAHSLSSLTKIGCEEDYAIHRLINHSTVRRTSLCTIKKLVQLTDVLPDILTDVYESFRQHTTSKVRRQMQDEEGRLGDAKLSGMASRYYPPWLAQDISKLADRQSQKSRYLLVRWSIKY